MTFSQSLLSTWAINTMKNIGKCSDMRTTSAHPVTDVHTITSYASKWNQSNPQSYCNVFCATCWQIAHHRDITFAMITCLTADPSTTEPFWCKFVCYFVFPPSSWSAQVNLMIYLPEYPALKGALYLHCVTMETIWISVAPWFHQLGSAESTQILHCYQSFVNCIFKKPGSLRRSQYFPVYMYVSLPSSSDFLQKNRMTSTVTVTVFRLQSLIAFQGHVTPHFLCKTEIADIFLLSS